MKGNPIKLGSIASKSVMKLKDKVMKMKKEAAMKMKKESMAKMKEAMAKMKKDPMMMKKDPMMMKKGSPMEMKKGDEAMKMKKGEAMKMKKGEPMKMKKGEAMKMKKGEPMKIKGPTKPKKDKIGGGFKVKQTGPNSFKLVKGKKGINRVESKISKKRFEEMGGTVLPASVFENTGKQSAPKNPVAMKKGQPMKQKMNMVKGPDGKMVPDFAVDGKGANDMKKSGAKMKKKSPNKGRFIKAMKAGDFKSAGKILKREGKAILAGSRNTRSGAANPTLAGDKARFDIGYAKEKKRQARKPVKITKRKPIKVGKTTISFRGEGDKPKTKS